MLKTKDSSLLELNAITTEFFSDYEPEFNYIKTHLDTYSTIPDGVTFASNFPNFVFIEVNESPKYLIGNLYEDRQKRKLAATFNKVRDLVSNGKTDEAISLYVNAAQEIINVTSIDCVNILKDTSRYDRYVEKN